LANALTELLRSHGQSELLEQLGLGCEHQGAIRGLTLFVLARRNARFSAHCLSSASGHCQLAPVMRA
jgi:hypothetical protein